MILSIGGSTYTTFWDQALSTNATQLGINAANTAKAMGVGIEIDYENDTNPTLPAYKTSSPPTARSCRMMRPAPIRQRA